MTDVSSFSQLVKETREWEEWGRRLTKMLEEVKEKTGDAALYIDDDGEVFAHPDLTQELNKPGNEGPLEFLMYMRRTSIINEQS